MTRKVKAVAAVKQQIYSVSRTLARRCWLTAALPAHPFKVAPLRWAVIENPHTSAPPPLPRRAVMPRCLTHHLSLCSSNGNSSSWSSLGLEGEACEERMSFSPSDRFVVDHRQHTPPDRSPGSRQEWDKKRMGPIKKRTKSRLFTGSIMDPI